MAPAISDVTEQKRLNDARERRIGPDMRMAVVGAPSYFAHRSPPKKPRELTAHNCINLRLPTRGGLYAWELEKGRRELHVRVDGQLIFNNIAPRINAVLEGLGVAFLPEDAVQPYVAQGRLKRVLEDWVPALSGLPPVLPESPSVFAGLWAACGRTPISQNRALIT